MSGWHIAQLNVGRILAPTDSAQLAEFMAALAEINARADAAPGFIWRLQSDSGNATDIRVSQDPNFLVNMSVWAMIEPLFDFVYRSAHTAVMARRRQWFDQPRRTRSCGGFPPDTFRACAKRWIGSITCAGTDRRRRRSRSVGATHRPGRSRAARRT